MREEECVICMIPLEQESAYKIVNKFCKTPCHHKFHIKCLR